MSQTRAVAILGTSCLLPCNPQHSTIRGARSQGSRAHALESILVCMCVCVYPCVYMCACCSTVPPSALGTDASAVAPVWRGGARRKAPAYFGVLTVCSPATELWHMPLQAQPHSGCCHSDQKPHAREAAGCMRMRWHCDCRKHPCSAGTVIAGKAHAALAL